MTWQSDVASEVAECFDSFAAGIDRAELVQRPSRRFARAGGFSIVVRGRISSPKDGSLADRVLALRAYMKNLDERERRLGVTFAACCERRYIASERKRVKIKLREFGMKTESAE